MADITFSNAWVDSYLEALLSQGLSAEHVKDAIDEEESSIAARYYVQQILSLDEERIRDAWNKASSCARGGMHAAERDERTTYLTWRVWGMKRRRAEVEAARQEVRQEAVEDSIIDFVDDEVDSSTFMAINELHTALPPQPHPQAQAPPPLVLPPVPLTVATKPFSPSGKAGEGVPPTASGHATPLMPPSPGLLSYGTSAFANHQQASAPEPLLVSRFPRLYIVLISLHGLVRGEKMELGKDPDTGGQVKYVVELAKALGQFPSVARVDLLTRLIDDPKVDASYGQPEERLMLSPLPPAAAAVAAAAAQAYGGEPMGVPGSSGSNTHNQRDARNSDVRGAFIVRLPCGPSDVYLRKEDLWPHVREFADRAIAHALSTLTRLQEVGPCELYVVHGHYADAGEAAGLIASTMGVDCVLTGHSLGRNKKDHLLKSGTISPAEVEATYRISRRIEAEERALDAASVVFTSTQQEVAQQWGTYDGYSDELSAALQLRPCKGHHVPRMTVIPPGLDFSNLKVSMPVDPWEEVLGGGAQTPQLPATPTTTTSTAGLPSTPAKAKDEPSFTAPNSNSGAFLASQMNSGGAQTPINTNDTTSRTPQSPGPEVTKSGINPPVTPTPAVNPTPTSVGLSTSSGSMTNSTMTNSTPHLEPHTATPAHTSSGSSGSKLTMRSSYEPNPPPVLSPRESLQTNSHATPNMCAPTEDVPARPHQPPSRRNTMTGSNGQPPLGSSPVARTGTVHTPVFQGSSVSATPTHAMAPNLASLNPGRVAALLVGEAEPAIWKEINRFLRHPGRPVILAMSRPDAKKNLLGLVKAYGNSRLLRELANLVLIMGNRDVIDGMAPGSSRVLSDVLKLIDGLDLYGCVAYPKKHTQQDISDIYLLAAATRGVFVNVALQEPFGLTLIEAAAHGVPIVATTHGGPVDIVNTLKTGVLVEPTDTRAIAEACVSLITGQRAWDEASDNGRRYITAYSWPSHCARYLRTVQDQKNTSTGNRSSGVFVTTGAPAPDPHAAYNPSKGSTPVQRLRHTLSLSYDDLGSLARAIASSQHTTSANIIKDALVAVATGVCTKASADLQQTSSPTTVTTSQAPDKLVAVESASDAPVTPHNSVTGSVEDGVKDAVNTLVSEPSLLCELRSAFSLPNSSAFISSLGVRVRQRSGAGGLQLPSAEELAEALVLATEELKGSTPVNAATQGTGGSVSDKLGAHGHTASAPSGVAEASMCDAATGDETGDGRMAREEEVDTFAGFQTVESRAGFALPPAGAMASTHATSAGGDGGARGALDTLDSAGDEDVEGRVPQGGNSGGGATRQAACRPLMRLSQRPKELQPQMGLHERYIMFNLDSVSDLKYCCPLIKTLLGVGASGDASSSDNTTQTLAQLLASSPSGAGGANGAMSSSSSSPQSVAGVGIMCTWGIKDLKTLLRNEGINPLDLDLLVCNAGAMIWHSMTLRSNSDDEQEHTSALHGNAAEGGAGVAGGALQRASSKLLCDDMWERHIDCRWDDRLVKQVVSRILENKAGWGRLTVVKVSEPNPQQNTANTGPSTHTTADVDDEGKGKDKDKDATSTTVSTTVGGAPLGTSGNVVAVRLSPNSIPLHHMLEVDVLSTSTTGKGAPSVSAVALQLLQAIRRKLRMSGLRVQLLITPREPLPHSGRDPVASADAARGIARRLADSALTAITGTLSTLVATFTRAATSPAASSDPLRSFTLHITPVRCTRALALRHLAVRFRRPLPTRWTLAVCTTELAVGSGALPVMSAVSGWSVVGPDGRGKAGADDAVPAAGPGRIAFLSGSDGEDLVGGVNRVVLLPACKVVPDRQLGLGDSSQPAVPVAFPVDVSAYGPGVVGVGAGMEDEGRESVSKTAMQSRVVVMTE